MLLIPGHFRKKLFVPVFHLRWFCPPLNSQCFLYFLTSNYFLTLNYFLWRLKTLTRRGVNFCWKSNAIFFPFPLALKFWSPTLNFQSHWQPAGHNFLPFNGFFKRPIMAHSQIGVHRWGPRTIILALFCRRTYNQKFQSVVQAMLICHYMCIFHNDLIHQLYICCCWYWILLVLKLITVNWNKSLEL